MEALVETEEVGTDSKSAVNAAVNAAGWAIGRGFGDL
jgi:hypothetical protein